MLEVTYGTGMIIVTSLSSKSSFWSSYSILTSHPPDPFSEGQQLTERRKEFLLLRTNLY